MFTAQDAQPGPVPDITIRSLEDRDIPQINALYIREYGPSYPYRLQRSDDPGIRLVAARGDQVYAFARATPTYGSVRVWEFGGLIVHPEWRGHHLARRLTEERIDLVIRAGGVLAMSEPVCYRQDGASQQNLIEHGFVLVGILPFKYPEIHTDLLGEQPESMVLAAKALYDGADTGFGRRRVYLPDALRDVLATFLPREVRARSWSEEVSGPMPNLVDHDPYRGLTVMGSDFVDIPINWASASQIIEGYLGEGYRFSAILPGFSVTATGEPYDAVRLYLPPVHLPLSFERIHVAPPLRHLHAYMAAVHAGRAY